MTNQHDNPIYYAHSPLGMRPSDMEYGPMRYVRETDYHVAQRKIAELEAALRVAREAIESLPADALGTATPIDAYPYPIRDEVINTISQALKG